MCLSPERRFERYRDGIASALAHADREQPARWYIKELMLPGKRKNIEPMAARVQPDNVRPAHMNRLIRLPVISRPRSTGFGRTVCQAPTGSKAGRRCSRNFIALFQGMPACETVFIAVRGNGPPQSADGHPRRPAHAETVREFVEQMEQYAGSGHRNRNVTPARTGQG